MLSCVKYLSFALVTLLIYTPLKAQNAVDVHSHIIVPEYLDFLKENNAEPRHALRPYRQEKKCRYGAKIK